MPHQHRHDTAPRQARPPGPLHGILWGLVEMVLRLVVLAVVTFALLAGLIFGLFALLGKAAESVPDVPSTTTSGP